MPSRPYKRAPRRGAGS